MRTLNPEYPASGGSILDWADSGGWDPVTHRFYFIGKRAGGGAAYRNIVYDEASNSWSYGPVPESTGLGHGYDGNTTDPVNGTHYFHPYSGNTIYKRSGSGWTTMVPSLPSGNIAGIAKGVAGLLYSSVSGDDYYPDSAPGTAIHTTPNANDPKIGWYHSITEYDAKDNVFLIGGGNYDSGQPRAMYKVTIVNGNPVRTRLADAPFDFGVGEWDPHTTIQSDPVTGEFIFYRKINGQFYSFNIMTNTWRLLGTSGDGKMPPLPVNDTSPVGAAISTYGVIMYVAQTAVYIYKHGASGPLDTASPAAPAALLAR